MMQTLTVQGGAELDQALRRARPGTQILLAPGEYGGGHFAENLHGEPKAPIVVRAADPKRPPRFSGGGTALQLSRVSHLELHDLVVEKMGANGVNIDDGGSGPASHHVLLRNLSVADIADGNHDGLKLSGLDDFRVENCRVARWGGSGIDMVGCHRGVIAGCAFTKGGDNGVQAKGGSSEIVVRKCRFDDAGPRGVNLGGSTGMPFFRPKGARYEAKALTVEGCVFVGGDAAAAFVGVDGATLRFCTLFQPKRWALRILQETRDPGFVPSRNGMMEDCLIVFRSDSWSEGGVNLGPGTAPETFRFARNLWFCVDRPERSRPRLPSAEIGGVYGRDPLLGDDLRPRPGSPAAKIGAHAWRG